MPAHIESEFSFDLDHIDQVTVRARGFKEFVTENLDQLEARVQKLVQSGQWTGAAAAAYTEAHQQWIDAARELVEGLNQMEEAARTAHGAYSEAQEANLRMTRG
ncbi:WXG100 family type VII secretion target [Mycobacterium sp. NPDC050853]|uniref:WXG100 family type VII secretion target n=1 Tax=Mycobacteriaceae TaxID=1762 RepID=UPI0015DF48D3|nr:WXG100 family type VII secretion target [Mycobacteroides sp. LB1]